MTNATKEGRTESAPDASIKVIGKAGRILKVFLEGGPELQLSQLADGADLDISTTSRIVASLTAIGVLRFDIVQRVYTPGLMLLELSSSVLDRFSLRELVHRELAAMSSENGWNCYFGVPDEKASGQLEFIDAARVRPQTLKALEPGQRRAAEQSASGLVFLAFGTLERSVSLLSDDATESLETTLATVRREGYAELVYSDMVGVAVPIWDASHSVVATLGIEVDLTGFRADQNAILLTMRAKARGFTSAIGLSGVTELNA